MGKKADKDNVVEMEQEKPEQKEWTVGDILRFNYLLTNALGGGPGSVSVMGDAHYWAVWYLGKMKTIVKAYNSAIQAHPDFDAYNDPKNKGKTDDELKEAFPDYNEYFKARKNNVEDDFPVKLFKAKWLKESPANHYLSAALIEFELMDNPDAILDFLYPEEKERG